ncbi:MAG: DUF2829 domain-containing protein [Pseudomonadota bacterium]
MTEPNPIIIPTIGRVVWYRPAPRTGSSGFSPHHTPNTPYAAIVACVWNDALVNLSVFDANGTPHSRTSVALIQAGQEPPTDNAYCEWMPFQKGQAARQDAAAPVAMVGLRVREDHREESAGAAAFDALRETVHKALDDGLMHHMTGAADPAWMLAGSTQPHCDFGDAIRHLKAGRRVARAGWNGKGMWLALSCDGARQVPAANFWAPPNREWAEQQPNGTAMVLPSITMKTATGEILMGWLASQTDMLAEDWVVIE